MRVLLIALLLMLGAASAQETRELSFIAPIGGLLIGEFVKQPEEQQIAYAAGYIDGLSHLGSGHTYDEDCLREITVETILARLEKIDALKHSDLYAWAAMRYVVETECPN